MIDAASREIADDAEVADGARVVCDRLVLGPGARIASGARIIAPRVVLGAGVRVGAVDVALNERLEVGAGGQIGGAVVMRGLSATFGEGLWLKSGTVIGGDDCAGPNSRLAVGDRVSIFDDCVIDLADSVEIGDDVGLSTGAAVITHAPSRHRLGGGAVAERGPVSIGDYCAIYFDARVLPGVTIGAGTIVGTGSVVARDVPPRSFAIGSPARVLSAGRYPPAPDDAARDAIVRGALHAWAAALPSKGVRLLGDDSLVDDRVELEYDGTRRTFAYLPLADRRAAPERVDITVAIGALDEQQRGRVHLDLADRRQVGPSDPLVEDLRDQLRRRGLRVPTDRPYASLPLANLDRLHRRRAEARSRATPGVS